MLRPERMTRALIVGTRDRLPETIGALHDLRLLHIVDHHADDPEFPIGSPLPQAAAFSEALIKLRSVSTILRVDPEATTEEPVELSALREKVAALELNIQEEAAAKKEVDALLADLARRIEEISPFATLGLPLDLYRGYDTVAVFVGRAPRGAADLPSKVPTAEVFEAEGLAAVFVPREAADEASRLLSSVGFSPLEVPAGDGDPRDLLARAEADREKWSRRRGEIESRLETLRERYAGFVVAAEDALQVEVEKAEAPLRFAVSDHSFVVDGWIPSSRSRDLEERLGSPGIHVEVSREDTAHASDDPPVLLKNAGPAKPFEFLVHLYSTPSYREIDPTTFLLVAFPFFFGFMIGDAGYGALFAVIGLVALAKLPRTSDFRNLLVVISAGGVWALLFGLFVFGEAFGMPFHLAPGLGCEEELAWSCFGVHYPFEPLLHKALDVGEIMYLSIAFAALHLGTSFVIGFVNEVGHNRKHALAKLGLLLAMIGIFTILTQALSWTRTGSWVWNVALAWFPKQVEPLGVSAFLGIRGLYIPFLSLVLLFGVLLAFGETPVAPLELGGLLANMMSYTRLAGIGIGKAAIATAFNSVILRGLVLDHDLPLAIGGFVLLGVAQLLVFLLGGISAAIQGIRLNYVESFIKFFKGNGTRFFPFGARKPQEA